MNAPPTLLALCALALAGAPPPGVWRQASDAERLLADSLSEAGLRVDLEHGLLALPATVLVRDELLEYALVGPLGQTHESLFVTEAPPSLINAALLALGVAPGTNARWIPSAGGSADAPPDEGRVEPPRGGAFYLYAAWRAEGELYLFRVDDLISNLDTGRSMRRHPWVFLGSRFVEVEGEEAFAADLEGNLVNVAFFFKGNTLVTAALPECHEQTIWVPNAWLLPPRGSSVWFLFSRERLAGLPAAWADALPEVALGGDGGGEEGR